MATSLATAKRDPKQPKPLPAPNSDFYQLVETLNAEELALVRQVRAFMETKVAPVINKYWAEDAFPFELIPALKELNIGGLGLNGYGCRGGSQKLFGLIAMEMARVDASFGTFFGVHDGLAMGSIYLAGSDEQKQKWLPSMARLEQIGCFGLTEPLVGSGAGGGLTTTAKREGDSWILNGQKKWIGNAPWCDISIIWARDLADNQVKGFIVENKTTPGFSVEKIQYENALSYAQTRLQFGKPIGSFQLIQDLLARMLANVTVCQCMMVRLADMDDQGKLLDHHAALAKSFCTARMRETVSWARELFGANGIVVDSNVARFFADAEALYSYEGTFQMQNLIVGKAITGFSAFV